MGTLTMTIQFINPPKEGKARGFIKGTNETGASVSLGCFDDKLHLFERGQTYDIEFTDGQYQNVKTAILVSPPQRPAPPPVAAPPARPRVVAAIPAPPPPQAAPLPSYMPNGDINRQTHPLDAERMFVCSILNASIQAGRVHVEERELFEKTMMLRRLWQYAFQASDQFAMGEPQQRQARG